MGSAYAALNPREQKKLRFIYELRAQEDSFPKEIRDEESRLEWLTHEFKDQLTAFQQVLSEQQFEIASTVQAHYAGDIAALSIFGTVVLLSKPELYLIRTVTSTRIYRPEIAFESEKGVLCYDASLKHPIDIDLHTGKLKNIRLSPLRGIAIRLNGETDHPHTLMQMGATYKQMGKTTLEKIFGIRNDSCSL